MGILTFLNYSSSNGADIHNEKCEVLRWCAGAGHLDIVKYLVELGCDVLANNDAAFVESVAGGHIHVAEYLRELGANPHSSISSLFVEAHLLGSSTPSNI